MVDVRTEIASPVVAQETTSVVASVMAGDLRARNVDPADEQAAILALLWAGWRAGIINQCLDAALRLVRETRSQP